MEKNTKNLILEELYEIENLTERTYNICKNNNLKDLDNILNYFLENRNFLNLRQCGRRSNGELLEVCNKYRQFFSVSSNVSDDTPILEETLIGSNNNRTLDSIQNLSIYQDKIINYRTNINLKNFSNRIKNIIGVPHGSFFYYKKLLHIVLNPQYDYNKIPNVGKSNETEIRLLFNSIREQINEVEKIENIDDQRSELINSYLGWEYGISNDEIIKLWSDYDKTKGIPIYKIINSLNSKDLLFEQNEGVIFRKGFNIWKNRDIQSNNEISSQLGLTIERIRQIKNKLYDKFDTKFSFLQILNFQDYNLYGLNTELDFIVINEDFLEEVNRSEKTEFNQLFVSKILSLILKESFDSIGDSHSIFFNIINKGKFSHNWKKIYLIKKDILEIIDFERMIADVNNKLTDDIHLDYSINFEIFYLNYKINKRDVDFERIRPIIKYILHSELNLNLDDDNHVKFERNTKKYVPEYIVEVLEHYGKPMSLYKIFDILNSKNSEKFNSVESLRSSCIQDDKLVSLGKNSFYGLKMWEEEGKIKKGTFYDLTEEYLNQFETPIHLDDIVVFVSRYRPNVTFNNLYSMLKTLEGKKRFIFFKNYHIGLISKQYEEEYVKNNKIRYERRIWENSFELLNEFISNNNRFPSPNGNKEEHRLYSFLIVQLNKIEKGQLNKKRTEQLKELLETNNYIRRIRKIKN